MRALPGTAKVARAMNAAIDQGRLVVASEPRGRARRVVRVAMVTNIPTPYRLPIYERLSGTPGLELQVFFCSGREPDRHWDLEQLRMPHAFLRERCLEWSGRFIHTNPDVWPRLREFDPDVVITTGFNPTHLIAFALAMSRGARHVAMTDGTADSESSLSFAHRWLRRLVYSRSHAFIGASEGSFELYRRFGVAESALFKSHLCANNPAFVAAARPLRDIDLIFCGRWVASKSPLFAIAVAAAVGRRLGRRAVLLLLGAGELEGEMRRAADNVVRWVDARFGGYARQSELPVHYARSRLMLFPSAGEPWGVVANEACAAGVPVIVSPRAGAANDLVRDGDNGRVLPLDVGRWSDAVLALLSDDAAWARMSKRCVELVGDYTYENATAGIAAAVAHAVDREAD